MPMMIAGHLRGSRVLGLGFWVWGWGLCDEGVRGNGVWGLEGGDREGVLREAVAVRGRVR